MSVLPIPDKAFAQHTLLLGKTRSGKSSKMRLIVERLLDQKKPVCIIDPKGDWWGLKSSADGKSAGYAVVIFGGEHAEVPINGLSGAAVAELVATGNRPAIIDLGGWTVADRTRFFVDFASTFFKLTRGLRWLAIDECHNFAPQGKVLDPQAGMMLHWANRLASEGAGKGITLLSASQRPQKVHKDYVTSHETLIALRVIHKLDRDAIKDWIDACGDPEVGKSVLGELAGMAREEAWVYSPEIGFGPKRITFPLFSTFDSFAAQTSSSVRKLKGWASVDLDEVRAKLASAVEEAAANDPRQLKARIAQLEREAKKPEAVPVVTGITEAEAARREKIAYAAGWEACHPAAYAKGFQQGSVTGIRHGVDALRKLEKEPPEAGATPPPKVVMPKAFITATTITASEITKGTVTRAAPTPRPAPPAAVDGLTGPQTSLLAAFAWWAKMGNQAPLKPQVAAIVGWGVTSSHLRQRLAELRSKGLITDAGAGLSMTAEGRSIAPEPPPIASTVEGLRCVLTGPQCALMNALIDAGGSLSKESLAAAVGWEVGSSHLRQRLAELRKLEVISGNDDIALQAWVGE